MKNSIGLLLIAFTSFLLSCSKEDQPVPEIHITGVELSVTDLSLRIGESETVNAIVVPANATDDKKVVWSTSAANVATVDNGKVTAVGLGESNITATAGGKTAICKVKVIPIDVSGISLNFTEKEIKIDETFQLTAIVEPDNATDKSVVWSSSNENIATVSNTGTVTGISVGKAMITVQSASGNISASCIVEVLPASVTGVSFKDNEISVVEGRTHQTEYIISPDNATNKNVTFKSHDTGIFTVDGTGLITGLSEGISRLSVISEDGNYEAAIDVTVKSFISELIIGMQIKNYSNPGGYITFNGSVRLSNYSAKNVFVNQFMILDANDYIITGKEIGNALNMDHVLSIPISFSNVYRARAVFVITENGKEYIIQKSL